MTKKRAERKIEQLTQTRLPTGGGKYPKYVGNRRAAAHYWSANVRPYGKAGNIWFENGVIYSYGTHFPIARHVFNRKTNEKAILLTDRTYSTSTASHVGAVRNAIPSSHTVFRVPDVMADTREYHNANFLSMVREATELFRKSLRARINKAYLATAAQNQIRSANDYARFTGISLSIREDDDLHKQAEEAVKEADRQSEEDLRKAREREKRKMRKRVKEWEAALAKWQADKGPQPGNCPDRNDPRHWLTFVRVSRGKYLQTTQGMTVPLDQVLPILEHIRRYSPAGCDLSSGGFKVEDWTGIVYWIDKVFQIGCHRVSFEEILRAASAAGL